MSHVATVDVEVKDLDALAEACHRLGLELVLNQQRYRCWYTQTDAASREQLLERIGETPADLVPDGFTEGDIGRCEHAVRVKDKPTAYEIGIVRRRDGRPGFSLLWDEWTHNAPGKALAHLVGAGAKNLKREYATVVARRQAMRQGFRVQELRRADGSVQLRLTK